MIRINLLPYKEATLVQWGQRQVLVYVAAVAVSVVVCIFWYSRLPDPEARRRALIAQRSKLEGEINQMRQKAFCDREKYRKRIRKANRKYKAVERLITHRRSPKYVLREVSRVLSEAWGPTLKSDMQGKEKATLYNQNWEPNAVWLTKFEEKARSTTITGCAKGSDDVGEFVRRLEVSAYFDSVAFNGMEKTADCSGAAGAFQKFEILARVNY